MKQFTAVLIALLLAVSLCACQPTPEQAVVVEKDSDTMLEKAEKEEANLPDVSLAEQYGIPETYQAQIQSADGDLNIAVDAQVVVPQSNAMPIYRVRRGGFSQELIDAFYEELCGDAEMWEPVSVRTKEEIEQQIIGLKEGIMEFSSRNPDDPVIPEMEAAIEQAEKEYATAPDTRPEPQRADGKLQEVTENGVTCLKMGAQEQLADGKTGRSISARIEEDNDNAHLSYEDYRNKAAATRTNFGLVLSEPIGEDAEVPPEILEQIGLTPSEARQQVQELLDKTGSNMVVDRVYLQSDEQNGTVDGVVRPAEQYIYRLECVRAVDGIPVAWFEGSTWDAENALSRSWWYETLGFEVNGDGIARMDWDNPLEIAEPVNEDASLLSFAEAMEIFEKMMLVTYEAEARQQGDIAFQIDRVTLSLQRVAEKNTQETGLLIPVWNFYGEKTVEGPVSYTENEESFLSINAVDGSVIDVGKGF